MERQRLVLSQNIDACEITACRPGLTLLEVNEKIIPDIAILQADGYSLYCLDMVDHLIEKNPQVYILLISESKDQQLLEQALEAGVDDFITGPPSDTELLLRVKKGFYTSRKKDKPPGRKKKTLCPAKMPR